MNDVNSPKCGMASFCKYSKDGIHCDADDMIVGDCPYLKMIQQITLLAMELTETLTETYNNKS